MTPPRSTPFAILLAAFFATSVSCAAPRPAAERTPPAPATPLAAAPELKPAAKLPPELASAGAGATFRARVDLRDQVDLLALGRQMSKQGLPRLERRRVVVDALRRVAQQGQARVEPLLAELRRRGDVTDSQQ